MHIDGRCHCGRITFEADIDANAGTVCHCTDCQTLTGSAFRANVRAPADRFTLLTGIPKSYIKTAESGNKRLHAFCGDCGTPVYATEPDTPLNYSLRIGTIDQRTSISVGKQIWQRSALPWVDDLAGVPASIRG